MHWLAVLSPARHPILPVLDTGLEPLGGCCCGVGLHYGIFYRAVLWGTQVLTGPQPWPLEELSKQRPHLLLL